MTQKPNDHALARITQYSAKQLHLFKTEPARENKRQSKYGMAWRRQQCISRCKSYIGFGQIKSKRFFYLVDEVTSECRIIHKMALSEVDDLYLQRCLMYVGLCSLFTDTLLPTKDSYTGSEPLDAMDAKSYLHVGEKWYLVEVTNPLLAQNYLYEKIESSRLYRTAKAFDETRSTEKELHLFLKATEVADPRRSHETDTRATGSS